MGGNKISIIIPHADRYNNLFTALESLSKLNTKPATVVVSDFSHSIERAEGIKNFNGKLNIKFVHSNRGIFVRGRAINFGRKFITTPLMLIYDTDLTVKPNALDKLLKAFGDPPKNLLAGFKGIMQKKNGGSVPNTATFDRVYGAFMAMRTTSFDEVGGHNPYMKGWGWQDVDLRDRLIKHGRCKEVVLNEKYLHIWHPPSVNHKTDSKNREIASKSFWNGTKWLFTR